MESGLHITLAAERLGSVLGLPITNTIITTWFVAAGLLIMAFFLGRRLSVVPGKFQSAVEMGFEYVYGYVEETLGSPKLARRYFPLIATIFVFILAANLLDFFPIFGTVTVAGGEGHVPLFHAVNADLNTPLALAIISFLVVELSGVLTLGILKYGSKFVNFKGGVMGFIIGLLEIIGNLARLVSLSFRLFGTIFAGEVILLVIGSFVPYLMPVPLMAFELFIGLLQAAIFAILTLAYIKLAVEEPHGTGPTEAHAGAH
jgi:F-type H+-transporting ATPase subunit a